MIQRILTGSSNSAIRVLIFGFVFLLLHISCDEHLPDRLVPDHIFGTKVTCNVSASRELNNLRIRISIINIYDETIEDSALVAGSITITPVRDASYRKTIDFTWRNLVHSPRYDQRTGRLVLNSADSLVFECDWDYSDDQGRSLKDQFFRMREDPTCPGRLISYSETIHLTGDARIVRSIPSAVIVPTLCSFCYVNVYIEPKYCPLPEPECKK